MKTFCMYLVCPLLLVSACILTGRAQVSPRQIGEALSGDYYKPNMEAYRMDNLVGQDDASYSGDLVFSIPALIIPGVNGHDFVLTLSYNSNISQRQTASWVGLGWDLEIGAVTRTILGRADEGPAEGCSYGGGTADYLGWLRGSGNQPIETQDQPDLYTLNVDGSSNELLAFRTTFENAPSFVPTVFKPSWAIDAHIITIGSSSGRMDWFRLTKEDGSVYWFDGLLFTEISDGSIDLSFVHRWQLTRIAYPDGAQTTISYNPAALNQEDYESVAMDRNIADAAMNYYGAGLPSWPAVSNCIHVESRLPSTISTDTHYAVFFYSDPAVIDYDPGTPLRDKYERTSAHARLDKITLYDRATQLPIRSVLFGYADQNNNAPSFVEPWGDATQQWDSGERLNNNQLTLLSVQICGEIGGIETDAPAHEFIYGGNPKVDWVYQTCGLSGLATFPGYHVAPPFATAWRLTQIKLPSGGTVSYTYEGLNTGDLGSSTAYYVRFDPESRDAGDLLNEPRYWSYKYAPRCRLKTKTFTDPLDNMVQTWQYTYGDAVFDPPTRPIGMHYLQCLYQGGMQGNGEMFRKFYGGCRIGHRWVRTTNPDGSWIQKFFTSSYRGPEFVAEESQPDLITPLSDPMPPAESITINSNSAKRGIVWKVATPSATTTHNYDFVTGCQLVERVEYFDLSAPGYYHYLAQENSFWPRLMSTCQEKDGVQSVVRYSYDQRNGLLQYKTEEDGSNNRTTEYDYAEFHYDGMTNVQMHSQLYCTRVRSNATLSVATTLWHQLADGRWLPSEEWLGDSNPVRIATYSAYDEVGNVLTSIDGNGGVSHYYYGTNEDPFSYAGSPRYQLTGVERVLGEGNSLRTSYEYDAGGNVTEVTGPDGNRTSYSYDGLGRIIGSLGPSGEVLNSANYSNYAWVEGVFQPNSIATSNFRSSGEATVTTHHFDGLGYPRQQTISLGDEDIVFNTTYDAMRREERAYKPYKLTLSTPHTFDRDFHGHGLDYWQSLCGAKPYTRTEYYPDGSGRVNHVHAPGEEFQNEEANHYFRAYYSSNDAGEIPGYPVAGELFEVEALDENGLATQKFTNRLGNVVAIVVDPGGTGLRTVVESDALGRTRKVWMPENDFGEGTDLHSSMELTTTNPIGNLSFTGLSPMAQGSVRVILGDEGGVPATSFVPPRSGQIVTLGHNSAAGPAPYPGDSTRSQYWVSIQYRIEYRRSGSVVGTEEGEWLSWSGSSYQPSNTYGVWPDVDEVRLVVTSSDFQGFSSVTVRFDYLAGIGSPPDVTYDYDSRGSLVSKSSVDGGTVQFLYDANGNTRFSMSAAQSESNRFTYMKYDLLNRVTDVGEYLSEEGFSQSNANLSTFPTANLVRHQAFTYDSQEMPDQRNLPGRISRTQAYRMGNLVQTTTYSYDEFGRVEWLLHEGLGSSTKLLYDYDLQGNLIKKSFTDLGNVNNNLYTYYEYDQAGRLTAVYTSVTDDEVGRTLAAAYSYLATGQVEHMVLGDLAAQVVDYEYNERDWITSINDVDGSGNDRYAERIHYYSTPEGVLASPKYNGNISAVEHWNGGLEKQYVDARTAYRFGYDGASRLTSAEHCAWDDGSYETQLAHTLQTISYDDNGNITYLKRYGANGSVKDDFEYHYSGSNRLANISLSHVYAYDPNGNVTADPFRQITSISYDYRNLPLEVVRTGRDVIHYTYDVGGSRIRKQQGSLNEHYVLGADGQTEAVYGAEGLMFWNISANGRTIGRLVP